VSRGAVSRSTRGRRCAEPGLLLRRSAEARLLRRRTKPGLRLLRWSAEPRRLLLSRRRAKARLLMRGRRAKATGWRSGRRSVTAWRSRRRCLSAKRRRRHAEHGALELRLRGRGGAGSSLRRGLGRNAGGSSRGSTWSARSARTRDPARAVHHEHRALELRGGSALQIEPALLASCRRVFVLSPTVRAKHESTSAGQIADKPGLP